VFWRSLRFRLLGAAAVILFLTLQLAGGALIVIFERNILRTADIELDAHLDQLASVLTASREGEVALAGELADPRFRRPFGGRYWQVSSGNGTVLRSRSLWDVTLNVPDPPEPGKGVQRRSLQGPDDQALRAAVLSVILDEEGSARNDPRKEQRYVLAVAMDEAEIRKLKTDFSSDVFRALTVLGILLVLASCTQVFVGLRPFEALRTGLEAVRTGKAQRLDADVPAELQPLVAETNALLAAQEHALAAARERAGNLAHGFKTPLTALAMLAQRLRRDGQTEVADEIDQQIRGLHQHVERELARSRIAAEARMRKRTLVEPVVGGLVRTMERLPRGSELFWRIDCPAALAVSVDEIDLAEVMGNLLDNARKWSRSEIDIAVRTCDASVLISIDDDGPGMPADEHARAMRRGGRLDERMPGSGLGLSIAKEIAEAYGGRIELHASHLGGLSARIHLPA
jgi:signal transduction histidine kinase